VTTNKPTGTRAVNALDEALQVLLHDYDALLRVRMDTEPSTSGHDAIERRLSGMRRQAVKLIDQLGSSEVRVAWKLTFGLI
jgi:hypothetical protein